MDITNIFDNTIQDLETAKKGVAEHISDSISKLYHLTVAQTVLREIGSYTTEPPATIAPQIEPPRQSIKPRHRGQLKRSAEDMQELSKQIHDALLPAVGASRFSPVDQSDILDRFKRGKWDSPWRIMRTLQQRGFAKKITRGKYRLT